MIETTLEGVRIRQMPRFELLEMIKAFYHRHIADPEPRDPCDGCIEPDCHGCPHFIDALMGQGTAEMIDEVMHE